MKALIQTCWSHTARSNKTMIVIMKVKINWITNFDSMFFSNYFRVTLSVFSLFFTDLIRHFRFAKIYRNRTTTKRRSINSFHIRNSVQNFPSRSSLKVTKVCKKNCNKSQKKIMGNNWSFRFFFLRNPSTNTGKKATNQNPKLVGLSKR